MNWKDPIWVFVGIGILMFGLANFSATDETYQVVVSQAQTQRLNDQWQAQMRRPPTAAEMEGLIDQYIKEEIYYREALRLGLDGDDTIVRRRLVQKLTFLTEDIATLTPPDDATLEAYYQENRENYRVPERISFRHRYFSADRRNTPDAPNAARDQASTAVDDSSLTGDPFMLQKNFARRSQREIGDLFGSAFAEALITLPVAEDWQGPVQSAYGWHPVQITHREASRIPEYSEIKERVRVDAQQAARREANQAYYDELRSRYEIVEEAQ